MPRAVQGSMLNETRKAQLADILTDSGNLPVYYPDDAEVYMRAGYLRDNTILCAFFNVGLDNLKNIALTTQKPVNKVEKLNPDGSRSACSYSQNGNTLTINEPAEILMPLVLFLN